MIITEKIKKGTHHDECKIGAKINRMCDDNYNFKEDCIIKWEVTKTKSNQEEKQ